MKDEVLARRLKVDGIVQGVGFRPFIYRTAVEQGLAGRVLNTSEDVRIRLNATPQQLSSFIDSVREQAPPASDIQAIDCEETGFEEFSGFLISGSRDESIRVTRVSPDIAVCDDYLRDMKEQPHRLDYPFLNCTNCGLVLNERTGMSLRTSKKNRNGSRTNRSWRLFGYERSSG